MAPKQGRLRKEADRKLRLLILLEEGHPALTDPQVRRVWETTRENNQRRLRREPAIDPGLTDEERDRIVLGLKL